MRTRDGERPEDGEVSPYRDELERMGATHGVCAHYIFTREPPPDWGGFARRIDAEMLRAVGPYPTRRPRIFVCGPTAFVEQAADLLVHLGYEPAAAGQSASARRDDPGS